MCDGDKIIASFEVKGRRPVPYSWHPSGYRNSADQKANKPNVPLIGWVNLVKDRARKAMAGRDPFRGPVELEILFVAKTPTGQEEGAPWTEGMELNGAGVWSKRNRHDPDTTNCQKALEDSLEGIVFANDVMVVRVTSEKVYGDWEGARIVVKEYARRV